jgi:hypothetical protein
MQNRLTFSKLLFGAVLYFTTGNLVMGAVLSLEPSQSSVGFSSSFTVDVSVNNVTDLYAYQFDIQFNPNLFSAVNVVEGPFLPGGGDTSFVSGFIDNRTGYITSVANSLLTAVNGVSGQGLLASVSFQSLSQLGSDSFSLKNMLLLDSCGCDIPYSSTNSSAVSVVAVATVPEPEAWGIMLLGIGLLSFQIKRNQALVR